jgi:hypothetical protein
VTASLLTEPAYRSIPKYRRTLGPEVADLNRLAGFGPDPEQELGLDAIFGLDGAGRAAAYEIAVIACRQNLKTGLFKQASLGWLFVTDERLVVWSAHEWDTVNEAFRDMDELITGSDFLRRRVKQVYKSKGDESIELLSGARLIFKTRTLTGGRGLSGRKVILDEGFALRAIHMGALLPTLSAQPDPQVLYGSSAGHAESAVLRGVRDRGRAGVDLRLAYLEWCSRPPEEVCASGKNCSHALDAVGCGCDDPANWQHGNPQLGKRIAVASVAAERRALPPGEFGRERMGWWDDPGEDAHPFPVTAWEQRIDVNAARPSRPALGLAVSPDRSMSTIGSAGPVDGRSHVDVLDRRPGTGWTVDRAVEIYDEVGASALVLDPAGPAGALEKDLTAKDKDGKVKFSTKPEAGERRLIVIGAREYAQACGALVDDVVNDRLRQRNRDELNAAVKGVRTKPLADAWAWSRQNSTADIGPLEVITLARHGHAMAEDESPFFGAWR